MTNFKKYFIEFFMIFLAVVLGFIAENFRENIGERSKEREYVRWLVKDMQTDTVILHRNLKKCESVFSAVDSCILLLNKSDKGTDLKLASLYQRITTSVFLSNFHKSAVSQLRNSEHAGLIQNIRVNDLIARFEYADTRKMSKERLIDAQNEKLINLGTQLFDNRNWDLFMNSDQSEHTLFLADKGPQMNQFIGYLRFHRYLLNDLLREYKILIGRFDSNIQTITDDYGITKKDIDEIWNLALQNSMSK